MSQYGSPWMGTVGVRQYNADGADLFPGGDGIVHHSGCFRIPARGDCDRNRNRRMIEKDTPATPARFLACANE